MDFAICVRNDRYPVSLELRKRYRVLPDKFADEHQMIRVIDESGEDYLYPSRFFVRVDDRCHATRDAPDQATES